MDIGLSLHGSVVREGEQNGLGRVLNPSTIFFPSAVGHPNHSLLTSQLPNSAHVNEWKHIFREDFLDPAGRIRRGRFYTTSQTNPLPWIVDMASGSTSNFFTFRSVNINYFKSNKISDLKILIGTKEVFSEWRVIRLEHINTGEILVTMKAKNLSHIIPDIHFPLIPEKNRGQITVLYEKLMDEIPRGLPESIIELCRNLASSILIAKNSENNNSHIPNDLGKEAKIFNDKFATDKNVRLYTISHCANIIARLHAEGKAVEQVKLDLPALNERDSDLAVHCISRILTALEWGTFS